VEHNVQGQLSGLGYSRTATGQRLVGVGWVKSGPWVLGNILSGIEGIGTIQ